MRTISISLDEVLHDKLKHIILSGKISEFVNKAIARELEKKEQELINAYQTAKEDSERQNLLNEWDALEEFSNN